MRILIIKTSALGDIIQTFPVVEFLKSCFDGPERFRFGCSDKIEVHFAVLSENRELADAHPLIDRVISFSRKDFSAASLLFFRLKKNSFYRLRQQRYDAVFDLQGNLRSGLIAFFAKSRHKAGFAKNSAAEWPNLLFTNLRYETNPHDNIRRQYLSLPARYFRLPADKLHSFNLFSRRLLQLTPSELREKTKILKGIKKLQKNKKYLFLIAPFSKWPSKMLSFDILLGFLKKIQLCYDPLFLFLQGTEEEKKKSLKLASSFSANPRQNVLGKLSLPLLQHVMTASDMVIAMDSCPLHLAVLADVPTTGFFGPSSFRRYAADLKPGHLVFAGSCLKAEKPVFFKRCPCLRTCPLRCIDIYSADKIFTNFSSHFEKLHRKTVLF